MAQLRLMACADLHGSTQRALSLAKRAKNAEVHAVVCEGDFSIFGAVWKEAIAPLVLGEGIPLFPQGTLELPLRLTHCELKTGGAVHVVYERQGR